jgi:phosphatidate cytidylyltransferase
MAIASGAALAVLFIGSLWISPYAFLGFIGFLVLVALIELHKAFRAQGWRPATPVVVGAGVIAIVGAYIHGPPAQTLGLALLLLGSFAWVLLDHDRSSAIVSVAASCLMGLWVPFLGSFAGLLLARPDGRWFVFGAIALAVTGDIAAYAFGNLLGRHLLAPTVSPAKTWEGVAGAVATVLLVSPLLTIPLEGVSVRAALLVGLGAVVATTVGDLAESLVKRDLGLKDMGGILPGHGGIMERADGVIFALPVVHFTLLALGL